MIRLGKGQASVRQRVNWVQEELGERIKYGKGKFGLKLRKISGRRFGLGFRTGKRIQKEKELKKKEGEEENNVTNIKTNRKF